jgi:hypothetical protein
MALAERVSEERAEGAGQTVGYQIRLDAKRSSETRVLFCTGTVHECCAVWRHARSSDVLFCCVLQWVFCCVS